MAAYEHVVQTFAPVYDQHAKILILGTLPSVKSREAQFYYGHPQNRFWKVIARLTDSEIPRTIEEKKTLLLENGIAVWDVIESCEIVGSSDSSIRNVVPADLNQVLAQCNIKAIYANGGTAKKLYEKYSFVADELIEEFDYPNQKYILHPSGAERCTHLRF